MGLHYVANPMEINPQLLAGCRGYHAGFLLSRQPWYRAHEVAAFGAGSHDLRVLVHKRILALQCGGR